MITLGKDLLLKFCFNFLFFLLHAQSIPRHLQAVCVGRKVSLCAVLFTSQHRDVICPTPRDPASLLSGNTSHL